MALGKTRFKILLVDDEKDNREVYKALLEREGFSVLVSDSVEDALLQAADSEPDLILSDVVMPGADGLSLCQRLKGDKKLGRIPVILLSGTQKGERRQTEGLESGADDYIPKPFSASFLAAKVRAVLRRHSAAGAGSATQNYGGLTLDLEARTASLKGRELELSRKEFDLLSTLLRKPGRVLGVNYLLETVWGYDTADYNDPHTVGVHISTLRKKLGAALSRRIVSVRGLGYRFDG